MKAVLAYVNIHGKSTSRGRRDPRRYGIEEKGGLWIYRC